MSKAPKKACKGCKYCVPYFGNLTKDGRRVISRYWCTAKSVTCPDPKSCIFRSQQ